MSSIVTSSSQHIDPHVLRIVRRKLVSELGVEQASIQKSHSRRLVELIKERVYCAGETNVAILRNFAQGQYSALADAPKRSAAPVMKVAMARDPSLKAGRTFSMMSQVRHNLDRINAGQPPMASIARAPTPAILWRDS